MPMTLDDKSRLRKTAVTVSVAVMTACLAVSLAALVIIIVRTHGFAVRIVSIEGAERSDEAEIRLITDTWLGRSLLSVKKPLLVYKLKEVPWIRDAKIGLVLPSTLKVRVTPRLAVALLNSRTEYGYKMFLLDAEGVIISQFGGGRLADYPVITGLELNNLYAGEKVELAELNGLLKVLGWMKNDQAGLYEEIEEINFENAYGVIRYKMLLTRRNIPVRTLRLDRDFFIALGTVLQHRGGLENIRSMTCLSNMIFVESRGSSGSAEDGQQEVRTR